jgi:hypothetical protein
MASTTLHPDDRRFLRLMDAAYSRGLGHSLVSLADRRGWTPEQFAAKLASHTPASSEADRQRRAARWEQAKSVLGGAELLTLPDAVLDRYLDDDGSMDAEDLAVIAKQEQNRTFTR